MKLKKISKKDPMVRINLSMRKSTQDLLESYRQYYLKVHGEDIEISNILEEIAKEFISTDKDFAKAKEEDATLFSAELSGTPSKSKKSSSATSTDEPK